MKPIIFNLIIYITLALLTACGGGSSTPVMDDITDDIVIDEVIEDSVTCPVVEVDDSFEDCKPIKRHFIKGKHDYILFFCKMEHTDD